MQRIYLKDAGISSPGSFEEETTLIGLTFGGYLRSKVIYSFPEKSKVYSFVLLKKSNANFDFAILNSNCR